uniref:Uncharacterized protein n=1 Tax=Glossina pallidipes TaxID=7398 RepID=A0A1A9ZIL6_GLOPL
MNNVYATVCVVTIIANTAVAISNSNCFRPYYTIFRAHMCVSQERQVTCSAPKTENASNGYLKVPVSVSLFISFSQSFKKRKSDLGYLELSPANAKPTKGVIRAEDYRNVSESCTTKLFPFFKGKKMFGGTALLCKKENFGGLLASIELQTIIRVRFFEEQAGVTSTATKSISLSEHCQEELFDLLSTPNDILMIKTATLIRTTLTVRVDTGLFHQLRPRDFSYH